MPATPFRLCNDELAFTLTIIHRLRFEGMGAKMLSVSIIQLCHLSICGAHLYRRRHLWHHTDDEDAQTKVCFASHFRTHHSAPFNIRVVSGSLYIMPYPKVPYSFLNCAPYLARWRWHFVFVSTYRICIARSVAVIPFQCRRSAIRWLVCAINTTNLSNVYSMLRFRHHEFRCSYLLSVVSPHTHTPHTHAIKSFEYFMIFEWWRRPFRNAVRCSCWKTKVYKSSIPSEQVCNGAGCTVYICIV